MVGRFERVRGLSDQTDANLAQLNVDTEYDSVRDLLVEASEIARSSITRGKDRSGRWSLVPGSDLIGAKLAGVDLSGATIRGSVAIAADFPGAHLTQCDVLGVDLRDANLDGANLDGAIYLTQMQVNSARGNGRTILPEGFERPSHWLDR